MLAPLSNNPWSTANSSLTHPTMAQRGGREAIREGQTTPRTIDAAGRGSRTWVYSYTGRSPYTRRWI
eukprot:contig_18576_g4569